MEDKQIISKDDQDIINDICEGLTRKDRIYICLCAPFITAYYGIKIGFKVLIGKIKEFFKRCK